LRLYYLYLSRAILRFYLGLPPVHEVGLPGELFLQLQQAVQQCLCRGRAAGHVNVHRHDSVAATHYCVGVVVVATWGNQWDGEWVKVKNAHTHTFTYSHTHTHTFTHYTPPLAQDPMLTTHLGSAIWSYTRRSAGAILLVSVPATIMTSDCLGDGRKMIPKRSRSYLGMRMRVNAYKITHPHLHMYACALSYFNKHTHTHTHLDAPT
jgi:hypothetical protein